MEQMELYAILLTAEERDALSDHNQTADYETRRDIAAKATAAREETHNGWANYETFHVRNWIGGDYGEPAVYAQARETAREAADAASRDFGHHKVASGEPFNAWKARREAFQERQAGEALKQMAENLADLPGVSEGVLFDLTRAALCRVDWRRLGAWALED